MIPYGRQSIDDQDIEAVINVLKSDFLTQGPKVKEFEDAFARYVGAKYAIAVSNGTAALHLACLALGVSEGQTVITTPNTFVASANSVLYCGGDVEFVDIDPTTYCLDLNLVEEKLKKGNKNYTGIIPVDFAGLPVRMDDFRTLADKYNLWLIEDACHAPGATFQGNNHKIHKSGSGEFADLAIFSFHPVKHIACGEGGMITTNDENLYKKLQLLRTHGITKDPEKLKHPTDGWYYEMQDLGFNYRMPDMLCALGLSQLNKAEKSLFRRQQIASKYNETLSSLPLVLPKSRAEDTHAYHLYVIRTQKRKELYDYLRNQGIYSQVHYIPVTQQPFYINKYGEQKFQEADKYYSECLSIPMYHSLTDQEQDHVIKSIRDFFKSH